ncbi:transporter substrate-binding domain-containing protein [Pleionea sediminis]|uniref:transporter substrate-binding domain-containing protein n=1 Tax=Pleionea sediminis TaxID=2569479 RepID=UPI0013DE20AB|nr:transporter substrate-binding domain-containing protein [Pleionea sediminis]
MKKIPSVTTESKNQIKKVTKNYESHEKLKSQPKNWSDIKNSGYIRALKLSWEQEKHLPRSGSTSLVHRELFEDFAEENGLDVKWIMVDNLELMLDALKNHQADIIPRHLSITSKRAKDLSFTQHLSKDKEVLIGRSKISNLNKQSITVKLPAESSYIDTAKKFFPEWQIESMDKAVNSDDLADMIANKQIDYTILDQSAVEVLQSYRTDIKVIHTFPEETYQAWAINKERPEFLEKLNSFISTHRLQSSKQSIRTQDLEAIKKNSKTIRMITRNSPETYFLWRGELMGFDYDLMKEFSERHGLYLDVVVAETYEEMLKLLKQGKGDIIAAGISRTEKRATESEFSIRYNRVDEQIVAHNESVPIKTKSDLKGRTIWVRKSSAFWPTAKVLEKDFGIIIKAADESTSTELLIGQVANKEIDLTIADSNLIAIEQSFRDSLYTPITLNEDIPWAYIVRKGNPQLLNAINAFIRKEYRGTWYNVVKNKYFSNESKKQEIRSERIISGSSLSPYDTIVKQHADPYDFDWRLIVSQMYQESRFNPKAQSHAGAVGLMQLLPRTAHELGYKNLKKPEESIMAGIEYLNWTRERFEESLPPEERLFFALAAYNAGYGHVKDAQKIAKQLNLNPNKWFQNVEVAMLKLQQPKYYKTVRFGYCRGSEPVDYVREIHQRYLGYVTVTQ